MRIMPPSRGSRARCDGGGSMLRLLVVACFAVAAVASLQCCGCFIVACRGGGVLRSDSGRMAEPVAHSADDLEEAGRYVGRRRLLAGGPGSHPPRCTSKCGSCSPCSPVHVSVPPGVLVTTEYYPEAWRCKCRDRLYMP